MFVCVLFWWFHKCKRGWFLWPNCPQLFAYAEYTECIATPNGFRTIIHHHCAYSTAIVTVYSGTSIVTVRDYISRPTRLAYAYLWVPSIFRIYNWQCCVYSFNQHIYSNISHITSIIIVNIIWMALFGCVCVCVWAARVLVAYAFHTLHKFMCKYMNSFGSAMGKVFFLLFRDIYLVWANGWRCIFSPSFVHRSLYTISLKGIEEKTPPTLIKIFPILL